MNDFRSLSRIALAAALFAGLAAGATAADITVRNAWMRPVRADTPTAGVYFDVLTNTPIRLVGATSAVAKSIAIVLVNDKPDGTSVETIVKQFDLPAGKETRFAYNGNRLDLLEVAQTLQPGMSVPIRLIFFQAPDLQQTVDIDVLVRGVILPPAPEPDAKKN